MWRPGDSGVKKPGGLSHRGRQRWVLRGLQLLAHVLLGPGFSRLYVFFILTLAASWSPQPSWLRSRCQYVIYSFFIKTKWFRQAIGGSERWNTFLRITELEGRRAHRWYQICRMSSPWPRGARGGPGAPIPREEQRLEDAWEGLQGSPRPGGHFSSSAVSLIFSRALGLFKAGRS